MDSKTVKHISECFVKPQHVSEDMKQPLYLTPWDLAVLSINYIQKGHLFTKPPAADHQQDFIETLLDRLNRSLSLTLVHFYPLAGRLKTLKSENPHSYVIFVDINDSPGARLIHASLDMTVSDIVSTTYVPVVVQSLFDHDRAINHDGHTRPLFSIQVTDLVDGIFIGCSMNHCLGDGICYWNFLSALSEVFQGQGKSSISISRPPIIKRWFPDGHDPIVNLPFKHHDEFLGRYEAPELLERSITRARRLPKDETTICLLAIDNRLRLEPPLSQDYFGVSAGGVSGKATAGELLEHDLGWAAWKLHQAVVGYTDKTVLESLDSWRKSPIIYRAGDMNNPGLVWMESSPRFNKYGIEYGLGKAVTLRSGYANKWNGKVSSYPGQEGGGSVDLEVCLPPYLMHALESDEEFMAVQFLSGDLLQRNSDDLLHRRSSVGTPPSSSAVTICSPAASISSTARGWIWVASGVDLIYGMVVDSGMVVVVDGKLGSFKLNVDEVMDPGNGRFSAELVVRDDKGLDRYNVDMVQLGSMSINNSTSGACIHQTIFTAIDMLSTYSRSNRIKVGMWTIDMIQPIEDWYKNKGRCIVLILRPQKFDDPDFCGFEAVTPRAKTVSATYVPVVVQSLFDNDRAINHDGHTKPLLSIQVTDLVDGIFIGCSMNHCLGDGTCFWNFLRALSEIFQGQGENISISRPPIIKRWFQDGHDPFVTHHDEFLIRISSVFREIETGTTIVSRLLWRLCWYCAGELLEPNLGWAAWKLHQAVVGYTYKTVLELLDSWWKSPSIYNMDQMLNARHVWMGSSPRFNKYGIEFGLGKAVTLRSGSANKFNAKVSSYPGRGGGAGEVA
ncbi:hypothetical protein EZV62_021611 [Acer yangbiense]|uniref:Uncharacterized protein n=1 Tax=Acer yangbiense TaxID=1000413 RepID=A0A5C7H7J9_9ROSI|nr:hypothetical protein EZV62_021611 [Acer yangbiense]